MNEKKDSSFRSLAEAREGMAALPGAFIVAREENAFEVAVPMGEESFRFRYEAEPGHRRPTVRRI